MIALYIIAFVLAVIGIIFVLKITPAQINNDITDLFGKEETLKDKSLSARGKKKKSKILLELEHLHRALKETGKEKQFSFACALSALLMVAGCVIAIAIDNVFLIPVLAVAFAILPFAYLHKAIAIYEERVKTELESALSLITSSYIRSENLVAAVEDSIPNLHPPLKSVFESFLTEATVISPDIRQAIYHMKDKVKNDIFKEWCDALIACQNDRVLIDILHPITKKLNEERVVNNSLRTMLSEARREYWMMVMLVLANIPLLYCINKSWYDSLMHTTFGKIVLAISGVVIIITAIRMNKLTKPIEYKR